MSCLSIITFPSSGSSNFVRILKRVDLPDPLGPINATIEPGAMARSKFSWIVHTFSPD